MMAGFFRADLFHAPGEQAGETATIESIKDALIAVEDGTMTAVMLPDDPARAAVDPAQVFGVDGTVPSFYSGKAYALSRPLMRYIAGFGAPMAEEHARFLHGAEDLMVGRLAERFQKLNQPANPDRSSSPR